MKQLSMCVLALVAATSCSLQRPRDVPLAEHLVGEWVLAKPPKDFRVTSQTDTVLFPDGTWDQHHRDYLKSCGTDDLETEMHYRKHPEERLRALEKALQLRLNRRWRLQGTTVVLYEKSTNAEKLVDRFVIRRYGYGRKELCGENCPDGPGPFSFIVVAARGDAPRTMWVRLPLSR